MQRTKTDYSEILKLAGDLVRTVGKDALILSDTEQQGNQEKINRIHTEQEAYYQWVEEFNNKRAFEVPKDPKQFYQKFGLIRHPETRQEIGELASYQYEIWKSMLRNKYTIVIKSQKSGITTSVLMADFQRAILPPTDPLSCMGQEILIVGQSLNIARQHIASLRQMIISSSAYAPYLITRPTKWLSKDEVSKVNWLYLNNPYEPHRPTKIIGLGPEERGLWSWKNVKHVHISDIAVVLDAHQRETIDAALSRLANTDGSMIIETPPRGPSGKVYEIWQKSRERTDVENPEGQFYPIRVDYHQAVTAKIIKEEKIDEYKQMYGSTFPQYFLAEFIAAGGNVFDIKHIEMAEQLGKSVNIEQPNPYAPTVLAIDPGFGSSKFAVVVAQLNNQRIEIQYAEEFETSTPSEMLRHAVELAQGFYASNIYMDASNPGMIRDLKFALSDNPDLWTDLLLQAKQERINPDHLMKVVPINFGTQGKEMLFHAQKLVAEGLVAINPAFDKLLAQMRSAIEVRGNLDKSRHSLDLIDALREALYFFKLQ